MVQKNIVWLSAISALLVTTVASSAQSGIAAEQQVEAEVNQKASAPTPAQAGNGQKTDASSGDSPTNDTTSTAPVTVEEEQADSAKKDSSKTPPASTGTPNQGTVSPESNHTTRATKLTGEAKRRKELITQILSAFQQPPLSEDEIQVQRLRDKERFEHMIDEIATKIGMTTDEKDKLRSRFQQRLQARKDQRISEYSKKLKAEFEKKFQFASFFKDTIYKMLDERFTTTELRTIEKFVGSPTGQKLIAQSPDMMKEGFALSAEHYVPIFVDQVRQSRAKRRQLPHDRVSPQQEHILEEMKRIFREKMQQGSVDSI